MHSRRELIVFADRLLTGARKHATADHALITLPGPAGGRGSRVDGLEGFARTFMLASFRIAGTNDDASEQLAAWYAEGIAAGTDPDHPNHWIRPKQASQARVEAASIALGLDMARRQVWDRLDRRAKDNVIGYLAEVVEDDDYPPNNWLWFRVVTETFLRSVDGPWSPRDTHRDLELYSSFQREDGWVTDGAGRKYDHYAGWAMHLYPVLWERMQGAPELIEQVDPGFTERTRTALDRYLQDAVCLVGGDGSPLIQGRSLIYRFAAAAPFWAGAMAQVPGVPMGQLRTCATSVIEHFINAGVPNSEDELTLGWFGEWPQMAQSYSGPSSPYWAAKGLLGIALPEDHPVWTALRVPLPIRSHDLRRVVQAPGWVLSGTRDDGIVRVANHGTDNDVPGSTSADSPLYARLGYSTTTWPLLRDADWQVPSDQSVTLIDDEGNAAHRCGMTYLGSVGDDAASSLNTLHWVRPDAEQDHFGAGLVGTSEGAGTVVVRSILHGPYEVRIVSILKMDPRASVLRCSGWAISTPEGTGLETSTGKDHAWAKAHCGLTSSMVARVAGAQPGIETAHDATPRSGAAAYPYIDLNPREGEDYVLVIGLSRQADQPGNAASVDVALNRDESGDLAVSIQWPDGQHTGHRFGDLASVAPRAQRDALQVIRDLSAKLRGLYPDDHTVDLRYPLRTDLSGEQTGANVGWTSGFWVGTLAMAQQLSRDPRFLADLDGHVQSFASRIENRVDVDHHDMGFLYTLAGTLPYYLTGDERLRTAALQAADVLMERYLENAGIIQAWGDLRDPAQRGRAIIDSLMNLPLLYWATGETGDQRYAQAARRHGDRLLETIIRDDGSTHHTYFFDPETGAALNGTTAQGAADDSTWARGQAWGIYGFALSSLLSGDTRFLDGAIRCADRFLELLPQDRVAYWDMVFTDGDEEPRDSSAAAIAVCGLLQLSEQLIHDGQTGLAEKYRSSALEIMQSLMTNYATRPGQADALLEHSVYSKPDGRGVDEGSIWGDYFYMEAMARLLLPDWVNPWAPDKTD